jgi:hypothetical protein
MLQIIILEGLPHPIALGLSLLVLFGLPAVVLQGKTEQGVSSFLGIGGKELLFGGAIGVELFLRYEGRDSLVELAAPEDGLSAAFVAELGVAQDNTPLYIDEKEAVAVVGGGYGRLGR